MTFEEFLSTTYDPETAAEIAAVGRYEVARRAARAEAAPKDVLKWCPGCGLTISVVHFSKDRTRKDGLRGQCRSCHRRTKGRG